MKIISPKVHAVLDYVVALFLIVAPNIIGLSTTAAIFSMVLGGIHFLLTLLTVFRGGAVKLVPFPVHGFIELVVSFTLAVLALTVFSKYKVDHFYYAGLSVAIFVVFMLTDYKAKTS
ncbi:hypothetical protein GM921_11640 [Pedobacter sp. LMG 31464]|uniref:Uncharacterized protein n=1 Tax=Pedobacter planticolens TaxID=2679964 RepID=A0A923DZW9_9SPHI|nr:hypothetical protein [Pedobacter planticolens]MBB2146141.1 hypothetical protein [Pedobacter planticolens]